LDGVLDDDEAVLESALKWEKGQGAGLRSWDEPTVLIPAVDPVPIEQGGTDEFGLPNVPAPAPPAKSRSRVQFLPVGEQVEREILIAKKGTRRPRTSGRMEASKYGNLTAKKAKAAKAAQHHTITRTAAGIVTGKEKKKSAVAAAEANKKAQMSAALLRRHANDNNMQEEWENAGMKGNKATQAERKQRGGKTQKRRKKRRKRTLKRF